MLVLPPLFGGQIMIWWSTVLARVLDVYKRQIQGQGRKAVHGVLQSAGRRRHDRRVQGIYRLSLIHI